MTVCKQLLNTLVILLLSLLLVSASQADVMRKADVRVLIDISGSMKLNDPQNLRKPAVELLVKLLPDSASAGIWTFAESSRLIVPDRSVNEAWRQSALGGANRITSTGLFTNIPLALKTATKDIAGAKGEKDYHIILLTDGMIDISKSPEENDAARKQFINDTLPELRKLGVKIHTIALSNNADKLLMEKIAIDTGGLSATAETADQLAKIFVQALDVAAPREQVPLKGNTFSIDKSIDEFTMLIFRQKAEQKITLIGPDQKRYNTESKSADVKWFHNEGYDLVTVKKPVAGKWSIDGDLQPGSRVTIVSDLSLQASRFPSSFFIGADDVITALLTENKKPIAQADFLKLMDMSVTVRRRDDNQFWQQPLALNNDALGDAPFASQLQMLGQTGTYDVTVKANGKTFEREQHQTVSVYDAFEVIVVAGNEIPPIHKITLIPRNPDIVAANSKVIAHVKNPDGTDAEPVAALQANETWQLELRDDKHSGEFRIWFEIEAKDRNDKMVKYKTTSKAIIHLVPGAVSQVENIQPAKVLEKPEAEKTPEPEPEAEHKSAWDLQRILMIVGIALGNILVLGLGYYVYRIMMSTSKKSILDQPDDAAIDEDDPELAAAIAEEEAALAATGDVLPEQAKSEPEPPVVEESFTPDDVVDDVIDLDDEIPTALPDDVLQGGSVGDKEDFMPKPDDDDDDFALPDDAIDIDPEADDDKK